MNRRQMLAAAAAAALAGSAGLNARALAAPGTAGDLDKLFDTFVNEGLDLSPESVTSLGLDVGARAAQKAKLGDRSPAGVKAQVALAESQLKRLEAFDASALSAADALNRDTVLYGLRQQVTNARHFKYASGAAGSPYVINQFQGSAFHDLPDFLDSQHQIAVKADAEAYLARLEAFATALDQDGEEARLDQSLGVVPPDFVLDNALGQLMGLRAAPAETSVLVRSLARRTKGKGLEGDWSARATRIYLDKVVPALDRQIALVRALRAVAPHDAGVWRLPDGDAYYAASVSLWTTTTLSGDEIHRTGLDLVARLSAETDVAMRAQGLTQGTVGQRFRAMYDDLRYRYANTDEGKAKLLADLNVKVAAVQARLPKYFGVLPKAKVEIKRIPPYTEAGAPGGYYEQPSLDGSRLGAYYINLRDTAEVPSWTLPTLTYHESIPGHHLQLSVAQEASLPLIRKLTFFSAYSEGWALYAEQLADEMGMYEGDPLGRIGYLHDALFRAVRLVVDSGIHAKRWSREQAIAYYVAALGDKDASAATEVERYCVAPGQACGYMLGKLTWLRERARAKMTLGDRFDIRAFHDAGLTSGAVPLDILPKVIDRYIASARA
jgi:uncharacterized protein (DUF885 family)